jgi:predicted nucleotidyltransferase
MDYPKGIEGDYIETKENNLFFDVKGLLHPSDRKICFLRFYPDPDGDRIKDKMNYKKVYDLEERYKILKEKFPEYLFFSKELDFEMQGVKIEDIKTIHTPRDYFKSLSFSENTTPIEKASLNLCKLIINEGGISKASVGISGSCMVGLQKKDSDIDIIIYGTETSLELHNRLEKIFNTSINLKRYSIDDYKKHYNWRFGGSEIQYDDFLTSEVRKLHQGKFLGIDFFIRYIKSPQDWRVNYYDYHYEDYGRIRIIADIIDDKDSIFTPCCYKIKAGKIIEIKTKVSRFYVENIKEIASFRGRFCEHAKKGETVLVEGKLEKVKYKSEPSYYRVLLTNQKIDKMIVLNNG